MSQTIEGISDQYANEEVPSDYGYFSGYERPAKITDQIDILRSHWPLLKPDAALRYYREVYPRLKHPRWQKRDLPRWVEGPFALVRPGFFSEKYVKELEEVFSALKKDRKGGFKNSCKRKLGEEYLRQTKRTLAKMRQIVKRQPGSDILIVPAQFGLCHRGRAVRRVRKVFVRSEFGLGAFAVGVMLLTNPIRLNHFHDLWIDCAGDEYAPDADGDFSDAPLFYFRDGRVGFDAYWFGDANESYGSASAFLLQ